MNPIATEIASTVTTHCTNLRLRHYLIATNLGLNIVDPQKRSKAREKLEKHLETCPRCKKDLLQANSRAIH